MDLDSGSTFLLSPFLRIDLCLLSSPHFITLLHLKLDFVIQSQVVPVGDAIGLADVPWGLRTLLEAAERVGMAWLGSESCSRHQV